MVDKGKLKEKERKKERKKERTVFFSVFIHCRVVLAISIRILLLDVLHILRISWQNLLQTEEEPTESRWKKDWIVRRRRRKRWHFLFVISFFYLFSFSYKVLNRVQGNWKNTQTINSIPEYCSNRFATINNTVTWDRSLFSPVLLS
jgi:hypothetical protein